MGNTGAGNTVVVTNNASLVASNIIIGASGSATGNLVTVSGGASVRVNGLITVGAAGGGNNSMFVTNATVFGGLVLGANSSNNTVTVKENVVWDFLGYSLKYGSGTGTGNVLNLTQISSTYFTNVGGIILGGVNQTFTLTNASGSAGRNIILGTGGSISVGDTAGLGTNTLIISNQTFQTTGANLIGNGSSNNALTILANTTWDGSRSNLTLGVGAAASNSFTITGGVVTNFGVLNVAGNSTGSGTLTFNSGTLGVAQLIVTNVVLGGVTLAGGRGSMIGVIGGVLVIGLLGRILPLIPGIGQNEQFIIRGILFIAVVGLNMYSLRRSGRDDV